MNSLGVRGQLYSSKSADRFAAVIVVWCILVGFPLMCRAADGPPNDSEIQSAVEIALSVEPGVSPHLVDVAASRGVVTLFGTVSNLLERDRAIKVAKTIRGVRSIIDRLEVRAVNRSDADILRDVEHALLLDPATDAYEIEVSVTDAVVTVAGEVESWAEKLLAAQVAKGVKGIKAVRNAINYSYESDRSDRDIEADIEGRLTMDPYVDQYLIDVRVKNGVVTLSGTVGSLIEKDYATSKAYVAGITRVVDDDLHVASWAQEPMERPAKVGIVTDAEAEKAVETALKYDPRVLSYDIDVQVENGKATLAGTVDNLKAKQAASRDTLNTVGIWKVESWIKVRPGDHLTDAEIGEDVRDALAWDPIVERFDISVLVRNRRVSLTGVVDTNVEKRHAADIASRVNGVASVDNHLVVDQAWPYKSDAEIKEDIESEYAWSPFVDGGDLTIRVDDGHVDIAGTVETWHEYREAVENAFEGGAKEVNSYMRVEANDRIYDRQWSQPPSEVWPL